MSLAASSYPLLNLFWTMFIPLIGVLVYLIVRGGSMSERAAGAGTAVARTVPQLRSASRCERPAE